MYTREDKVPQVYLYFFFFLSAVKGFLPSQCFIFFFSFVLFPPPSAATSAGKRDV